MAIYQSKWATRQRNTPNSGFAGAEVAQLFEYTLSAPALAANEAKMSKEEKQAKNDLQAIEKSVAEMDKSLSQGDNAFYQQKVGRVAERVSSLLQAGQGPRIAHHIKTQVQISLGDGQAKPAGGAGNDDCFS